MPAAAPVAAAYDWSGFYIGAHGGWGWGDDPYKSFVGLSSVPISGPSSKGYVVGGHAGYNAQWGALVGGIEIDMSSTGIKGSNTGTATQAGFLFLPATTTTQTVQDRFDYLASARARLGFTPWQSVLFYGTAGPAWLHLSQTTTMTAVAAGVTSNSVSVTPSDHFGLAVGGGAEVALGTYGMAGWLARIEYLHYDFGTNASSVSTTVSGGVTTTSSTGGGRLSADVVRGGLSFKFH